MPTQMAKREEHDAHLLCWFGLSFYPTTHCPGHTILEGHGPLFYPRQLLPCDYDQSHLKCFNLSH